MTTKHSLRQLIRRDFIRLSATTSGALGVFGALGNSLVAENPPILTDRSIAPSYVEKGLNALARAHQMNSMAGHLGASLIAGYYVGMQRPNLDPIVYEGIQGDLERVIQGESVFGKRMSRNAQLSDAELFAPMPHQPADQTLIDGIAEGLQKSIDQPRQSGHNVIFASLAIRALKDHPEYATPARIDGIRKLMDLFIGASPGSGYYGKNRGRIHGNQIELAKNVGLPAYDDIPGMVRAVIDETLNQNPTVHRIGYGGLVHIINHAAAITDLADLGYVDLASRAVQSHHHHLQLWRDLPNVADEKGMVKVSKHTPHSAAYWTSGEVPYDRALLTHRVKTMFGFDELVSEVDQKRKVDAAYDKLRYLM